MKTLELIQHMHFMHVSYKIQSMQKQMMVHVTDIRSYHADPSRALWSRLYTSVLYRVLVIFFTVLINEYSRNDKKI